MVSRDLAFRLTCSLKYRWGLMHSLTLIGVAELLEHVTLLSGSMAINFTLLCRKLEISSQFEFTIV